MNKYYNLAGYLQKKYWDEGLSLRQIAKITRTSDTTVHRWMIKHQIKRRNSREGLVLRFKNIPSFKENNLQRMYLKEKLSISEIANRIGVAKTTVRERMLKLKIKFRSRGDGTRLYKSRYPKRAMPRLALSPELAYVLGACYGDGSVCCYWDRKGNYKRYVVSLEVREAEFAKSFKEALEKIGLNPFVSFYEKKNVYRVRSYSKEFYTWFRKISMDKVERLVAGIESFFIKGIYESEGSLGVYNNNRGAVRQLSITNTNKQLLLLTKKYLEQIDIHPHLRTLSSDKNQKDCYQLYISRTKDIHIFLEAIKPCIKNVLVHPNEIAACPTPFRLNSSNSSHKEPAGEFRDLSSQQGGEGGR